VNNSFISLRQLALTLHHLDARRMYLPDGSPASSLPAGMTSKLHRISLRSIHAFAGMWLVGRSDSSILYGRGGSNSSWKHIEQSFRFLKISQVPGVENACENSRTQGIHCVRVDGSLQVPRGHELKAFKLIEGRYTVAVTTTMMLRSPVYSITLLFDNEGTSPDQPELDQKSWLESKLELGVFCKGITVFQLVLFKVARSYSDAWTRSLDVIDQMVQVLVS